MFGLRSRPSAATGGIVMLDALIRARAGISGPAAESYCGCVLHREQRDPSSVLSCARSTEDAEGGKRPQVEFPRENGLRTKRKLE
jgi:hypothetical protein